jgi:plastocyanin
MRKIVVIVALAATLLGGCADTEEAPEATATNDTVASTAPSSAPSPTASSDGISAGGECMDASETEGQADLEMQDFVFAPPCLIIAKSQGLRLHNEGDVKHNFSVKNFLGLDVDVEPGAENNTEPLLLDIGEYEFFCKYHADSQNMKGKLEIQEG